MTTAWARRPRALGGRAGVSHPVDPLKNPWNTLWAMMIGFFMIMVDSTIVAIANPTIMADLHAGYDAVVWVTSAYLLGYAVVLLVAGRLGDRFGPKNLYLIGLALFTAASLWCGLSGSAAMLIAARVVQGVGAGVLTPQTLSTITRTFPPQRRGVATSLWGATAGVASLVGPLAGGLLVDGLGWEWIFFVNLPIGIAGLVLGVWLVPELPVAAHQFDLLGVALSGVGMFLIVFGLQQGQAAHWDPGIWAVIVAGVGFMAAFVYWQSMHRGEPLIPLRIFFDRDFSVCSVGVAIVAFATTAVILPVAFYAQGVCGLSPTRSALLIAPMAIANGVLAPLAGRIVDRRHPLPVLGFGFSALAISLTWLSTDMNPDTPIWRLLLPFTGIGAGMAFVWSPLTATATRNLPPQLSGASSGVYNAVRQLGAVLGSAAMAAFMTSRISAEMPARTSASGQRGVRVPAFVREPFSAAMSQSVLLPAFIALLGVVAALFLVDFKRRSEDDDVLDVEVDEDYDDDPYVEYILLREPEFEQRRDVAPRMQPPAPARAQRVAPGRYPGRGRAAPVQPIGFAHNGSHIDVESRARRVEGLLRLEDEAQSGRRHRRSDPDDPASRGR
jgi:EmrB/QacA subfamily drug resistance transporter